MHPRARHDRSPLPFAAFRRSLLCALLALGFFVCCGDPTPGTESPATDASQQDTSKQEATNEASQETPQPDQSQPQDQTPPQDQSEPPTDNGTPQEPAPTDSSEPSPADSSDEPTTQDTTPQESPADASEPGPPEDPPKEAVPEGCPSGQTSCIGACVDLKTDDMNCGKCGTVCPKSRACFDGACLIPSKLWGKDGAAFKPTGRLMDWSYAGYGHGEKALPNHKPTVTLTSHGAKADDGKDDTAAFEKALAAVANKGGTIGIPKGTFILTRRLRLPSNVVIQGAGIGQTIISIPKSLTDVYGNKGLDGGGTSSYSFGGAFFEVRGGNPVQSRYKLATITNAAKRGGTKLTVDDASKLKAKQWVLMVQTDANRSLMNHLHAGLMKAGDDNVGDSWTSPNRIVSISGKTVTFERAFPVNVEQRWKPALYAMTSLHTQIGIEKLTISFPKTKYPGHFKEKGYNAIDFHRAYQCWVRQVRIEHADYGVNVRSSYNLTVAGVTLFAQRPNSSLHGHHGLNVGHGADHLLINFNIDATFVHDLTVEWYSTGNVFTKGKGRNIRMDHHRAAPYLTLWTELHLGQGKTPFTSGGRSDRGPHTAAYSTFWNLDATNNMSLPPNNYGPRMNFIGFRTGATKSPSSYDWWLETIKPAQLGPKNLWEAMRQRRLGRP